MKTNLNVFSFSLDWRYYLRHPIAFLKDIKYKTIAAYHRVRYGYCDVDVWELCEWFLTIMPQMLRQLAGDGVAYPGNEEFDTEEKWEAWLQQLADNLEKLQDEEWEKENPFYDDFYALDWRDDSEAAKAMRDNWVKATIELQTTRQNLIENCMNELGRNFFHLWD